MKLGIILMVLGILIIIVGANVVLLTEDEVQDKLGDCVYESTDRGVVCVVDEHKLNYLIVMLLGVFVVGLGGMIYYKEEFSDEKET